MNLSRRLIKVWFDIKKHFYDKNVSAYVAKKQKVEKIPQEPSSRIRVETDEEEKPPKTLEEVGTRAPQGLLRTREKCGERKTFS